jgi:hypothetical protein
VLLTDFIEYTEYEDHRITEYEEESRVSDHSKTWTGFLRGLPPNYHDRLQVRLPTASEMAERVAGLNSHGQVLVPTESQDLTLYQPASPSLDATTGASEPLRVYSPIMKRSMS